MLPAVPGGRGAQGRQHRHRRHQEQEVRPVCGLVPHWVQGTKSLYTVHTIYYILCTYHVNIYHAGSKDLHYHI